MRPAAGKIQNSSSKLQIRSNRCSCFIGCLFSFAAICGLVLNGTSEEHPQIPDQATTNINPIDLPSALRLAGAQNLDIKIARERVAEARANHSAALAQFFPWLSAGVLYRHRDGKLHDVEGNIIGFRKNSYPPGATIGPKLEDAEALYQY